MDIFTCEKVPQNEFSRQNVSVENNIFFIEMARKFIVSYRIQMYEKTRDISLEFVYIL